MGKVDMADHVRKRLLAGLNFLHVHSTWELQRFIFCAYLLLLLRLLPTNLILFTEHFPLEDSHGTESYLIGRILWSSLKHVNCAGTRRVSLDLAERRGRTRNL